MTTTTTAVESDLKKLTDLNAEYIRSVQESDVKRFDEILSDDFMCGLSDGSLVDRAVFLEHTAHPAPFTNLQVHDVNIRLMGDFAIIHARTTYVGLNSAPGASRYTDVWARRGGQWLAVSAQITRY